MSKRISMLLVVVLLVFVHPKIQADDDGGSSTNHNNSSSNGGDEIKVGMIVDLGSWTGQNILNCIQMAVADFYVLHSSDNGGESKRGIVLHTRDSMGDPMHALTAAADLLESVKVEAILVAETYSETKILALLADKAKTPIFTFSPLYERHTFLVQIKQDHIFQFKGLANVLTFYEWNMVNIVYEDSYYGRESLPFLIESLEEEERVHVAHKIAISGISTDNEIVSLLDNLATSQTTINIVHVSTLTIIDRLFLFVKKRMGIMKPGHVWIFTEHNMNTLDDKLLLFDSMQAVVIGIKPHILASSKLAEFTRRWRQGLKEKGHKTEVALVRQPCFSCILAYDTLWALADCLERVQKQPAEGRSLLNEMGKTSFAGLSGEFRILNGKIHSTETYAIMNVNVKTGERIVGYWTRKHGLVKEAQVDDDQLQVDDPGRGLQAVVVWPKGGRVGVPARRLLGGGKKKLRIGVFINPGYPEFVNYYQDPLSGSIKFKGYCIEVFEGAISSLDYEIAYEIIPHTNGGYSEMIKQVYDGVFDGVLGDLTITANRSLYLDFTMPYTDLGVGTIAKQSSGDMWVFTRPLSGNLWLMSGILFALIGVVVWIIEHPDNEEFQGSISKQVGTILSFGFSTLVFAHKEKLKSNLSKFVVNVWLFAVLILTSSYTATLSSLMTIRQIQLAGNIGIQSTFLSGAIIESNVNFTGHLRHYKSPEAFAAALSEGSKNGGVAAIIDEIPYIKIFLAKYGRDYSMVASKSNTDGFAFGFRKGLPSLVSDMSRAILEMREEGRLAMLEDVWYNMRKSSSFIPPEADATPNPNELDLYSFSGLFLIISISIAFALIMHLIFMQVKRVQANSLVEKVIFGGHFAFFLRFLAPRNQKAVNIAIM